MLDHGLLKRIKPSNRGSCLRWSLEQGGFHVFLSVTTPNTHIFTFAAFTSSDEVMQEAAYHALSMLRFDHPLPLATFVSILVTLGAKPDVLTAAGFDVKPSDLHRTRIERETLLREWLILVERLSRCVTFPTALLCFV